MAHLGMIVVGFFAAALVENPLARWLTACYYRAWRRMLWYEMTDTGCEMAELIVEASFEQFIAISEGRDPMYEALAEFMDEMDAECVEINRKLAALQPQPLKGNTP